MKFRILIIFSFIITIILILIFYYIHLHLEDKKKNSVSSPIANLASQQKNLALDSSKNLTEVALFFAAWGGDYLLPEKRNIFYTTSITDQAKQTIIELIEGPKKNYLLATIPKGTTLRELYLEPEGTAYIDLSQRFTEKHWGGSRGEIITLYSIINTLTINFPSIQQVKILVEGKEIDSIAGHLNLRKFFSPDFSFIGDRKPSNEKETSIEE